jgi:aryl-alcohol dehydrogenase-like predicted oxidoreductase
MVSRREILTAAGVTTIAAALPAEAARKPAAAKSAPLVNGIIPKRTLGRTGAMVTPLALGGQAALERTPADVDPADIIVRAVELGVNYLDSANGYGPSQMNYGEAFRRLNLVPGKSGYDAALRDRLYIASKTGMRLGRDPQHLQADGRTTVTDIERTMTQMFGDGKGFIPEGAYLDAMQIHAVMKDEEVDRFYLGMKERGGKMPEAIGAFATLIDYRDGTNYTGLNPQHRRWIRHIGITGHQSSPVLMRALRLDEGNNFDTLLTALNVNDKLYQPHQLNVVPLAVARGMGVIAMKLFADGVLFGGKPARVSKDPSALVTTVGKPGYLSYHDMIRYTVSLPGVSCAVIGTGHIDRKDPSKDQLVMNLAAAIDTPMGKDEREKLEAQSAAMYGATTNYFQNTAVGLVQPSAVKLEKADGRVVVSWQAGYAGAKPIAGWQIKTGGKTVLTIPFRQQLTMAPLTAYLTPEEANGGNVEVVAVEEI